MEISSIGLSATEVQTQHRQHNEMKHNIQNGILIDVENPYIDKLNGRYIILQNQLNSLQHEYTREQTRLSLLELGLIKDEDLVKVFYANSPLFDESLDELINEKSTILEKIKSKKEQLKVQIEVIQTESDVVIPSELKNPADEIKKLALDKLETKKFFINQEEKEEKYEQERLTEFRRKAIEIKNALKPFKDTSYIERLIS
jgi:hypothetical protein